MFRTAIPEATKKTGNKLNKPNKVLRIFENGVLSHIAVQFFLATQWLHSRRGCFDIIAKHGNCSMLAMPQRFDSASGKAAADRPSRPIGRSPSRPKVPNFLSSEFDTTLRSCTAEGCFTHQGDCEAEPLVLSYSLHALHKMVLYSCTLRSR